MPTSEISTWLEQGLAAAKSGNKAAAREQLLRVIEADEQNLRAWQALSDLAITLEDKEICLENVLTLDPDNEVARQQLDEVQARLSDSRSVEVEKVLEPVPVPAAMTFPGGSTIDFTHEQLNDPYLCVYCGQPTRDTDQKCPHCQRALYVSFFSREKPHWLGLGWALNIFEVMFHSVLSAAILFFMATALTAVHATDRADLGQLLLFYGGQNSALSMEAQSLVLSALPREFLVLRLIYVVVIFIDAIGLLSRKRIFHIIFAAASVVSLGLTLAIFQFNNSITAGASGAQPSMWQGLVFNFSNTFMIIVSVLSVFLLVGRIILIFVTEGDFDRDTERLWNQIDTKVKSAHTAFIRAKAHMQRDRWTLAAAYLQQAITLETGAPDYYIALAESYAHLRRYASALRMLDQAEELKSAHPSIARLRGVILELQQRAVKAAGLTPIKTGT